MKSERGVARAGENNDLKLFLFWFNQALSFLHGVYISRPSEPARVKRRSNLHSFFTVKCALYVGVFSKWLVIVLMGFVIPFVFY
jgi:hypothetical protein